MDAKKFGAFIAMLCKENNFTQLDLAKKLQVTDKAVSKWERGLGFPDINTIEPLADALGLSILEIMKSEKIVEPEISPDTASSALLDTFEIVKSQRKAERIAILKISGCIAAFLAVLLLIDSAGWMIFLMAYFPAICLLLSIFLLLYSFWRKKRGLSFIQTFVIAVLLLLIPAAVIAFLFLCGIIGLGPVPN